MDEDKQTKKARDSNQPRPTKKQKEVKIKQTNEMRKIEATK